MRIKSELAELGAQFAALRQFRTSRISTSSTAKVAASVRRSVRAECILDRRDRKVERKRIVEKWGETVLLVKRPGLLVDGVDLDGVDAKLIRQFQAAMQGIDQQSRARALAL